MSPPNGRSAKINGFVKFSPTYRSRVTVVRGCAVSTTPTESGAVTTMTGTRQRAECEEKRIVLRVLNACVAAPAAGNRAAHARDEGGILSDRKPVLVEHLTRERKG